MTSDPLLLSLLGVRLRSIGETDAVADLVGLDGDEVAAALATAQERGWATHRSGRLSGWVLTPDGRSEGERLLAAELDDAGLRPVVHEAYRRFLDLNPTLLDVCTDWQLREVDGTQVPNDHSDAAHDAAVLDRLHRVDEAAQPVCADLAGALGRFATYAPRFAHALARVDAGERDWFAKPTIPSYHTVWFELHEHLLATLGIDRAQEAAGRPDAP